MADIPTHHMIYGSLVDYVTGEPLVDTDDERYRQKLARLLVEERGFANLAACQWDCNSHKGTK